MSTQRIAITDSLQRVENCCSSSSFYDQQVESRLSAISLAGATAVTALSQAGTATRMSVNRGTVAWHQFTTCFRELMAVALCLLIVVVPRGAVSLYSALSLYKDASLRKKIAKAVAISIPCFMVYSALWSMIRPDNSFGPKITLVLGTMTALWGLFVACGVRDIYHNRRLARDLNYDKRRIGDLPNPQEFLLNEMASTAATRTHLEAARTALKEFNGKSLKILIVNKDELRNRRCTSNALCDSREGEILILNTVSLIEAVSWTVFELGNMRFSKECRVVSVQGLNGELSCREFGYVGEYLEYLGGERLHTETLEVASRENPSYMGIARWYLPFRNDPAKCIRNSEKAGHTESFYEQWNTHCARAYRERNPGASTDRMDLTRLGLSILGIGGQLSRREFGYVGKYLDRVTSESDSKNLSYQGIARWYSPFVNSPAIRIQDLGEPASMQRFYDQWDSRFAEIYRRNNPSAPDDRMNFMRLRAIQIPEIRQV